MYFTFIRAINGENTTVTLFSSITAGNWKHNDFPDPVGIETKTSFFPKNHKIDKPSIK